MLRALVDKITREHLLIFIPAILVAIIGFWAAYQYVGPAPPRPQDNARTGMQ